MLAMLIQILQIKMRVKSRWLYQGNQSNNDPLNNKNIPDIVMSIDTSIRQQLLNTKTYRTQTLHKQAEELSCQVFSEKQETVSHVLRLLTHIYLSQSTKLDLTKCFALSIMLFLKKINMDLMNVIILLQYWYIQSMILSQAKKTTEQRYYGT